MNEIIVTKFILTFLTNLLETVDAVTRHMLDRAGVQIIYLDFSKAFDTVPHENLLCKLKAYDLGVSLCAWLRDFLSGRIQRVVMGEHISEWKVDC